MKIRMLTNTNYNGFKRVDEIHDVPEVIAQRWLFNGIAESAEPEEIILEYMSSKELYKYCVEQGLEVEPKKSKDYYLEVLKEAEANE